MISGSPGWSGLIWRRWDASLKIFGRMEKSPMPLVRKVIRAWEKMRKTMRKTMRKEKLNEVEAIWIIFESFERCQQVGLKVGFHLWSGWDLWTFFFLSRSSIYDMSVISQTSGSSCGNVEVGAIFYPNFYRWFNRVQLISTKKKSATISSDPPWVPRWLWRRALARPERFGPNLRPPISCIGTSHPSHPITIVP